jgi:hypothetical protein
MYIPWSALGVEKINGSKRFGSWGQCYDQFFDFWLFPPIVGEKMAFIVKTDVKILFLSK